MKNKKWFTGILAVVFALSLAGTALAQGGGVCGREAGSGRGNCTCQSGKCSCTNDSQCQGRKKGQGRQQRQCGSKCPIAPATSAPASKPVSVPSN